MAPLGLLAGHCADEVVEWLCYLLRCMSPDLAPNGHADPVERCPLLGPKQKTSARSEHFAF
jgi:hypothetical protein